ncbi:hypothetical protein [Streptosporangium sp. NPDC051022]|uniref:hypothetical protein n=1 Tax=Streptosporangium sp. NPDC051022 TaxID=3155752 RepID=UPI0034305B37
MPPSQEVLNGAMTDEQRAELAEVREVWLQALEALNRHPWWRDVNDRYATQKALRKAAEG